MNNLLLIHRTQAYEQAQEISKRASWLTAWKEGIRPDRQGEQRRKNKEDTNAGKERQSKNNRVLIGKGYCRKIPFW